LIRNKSKRSVSLVFYLKKLGELLIGNGINAKSSLGHVLSPYKVGFKGAAGLYGKGEPLAHKINTDF
jgi:hypothetical protein